MLFIGKLAQRQKDAGDNTPHWRLRVKSRVSKGRSNKKFMKQFGKCGQYFL
jgi:hypothetical protein